MGEHVAETLAYVPAAHSAMGVCHWLGSAVFWGEELGQAARDCVRRS
jgi:hypothetical protein